MENLVVLIGRLVARPELRYTGKGTPVTNFTLAVERTYKNKEGEKEVDFINIVTWRALAENCAKYLDKGRLVYVKGSLQIKKSENNNRTYINPEVNADNVRFLDFGKSDDKKSNVNGYEEKGKAELDEPEEEFDPDDFDYDENIPF